MKHSPIFLAVEGRRIVIAGGRDAALAKLRHTLMHLAKAFRRAVEILLLGRRRRDVRAEYDFNIGSRAIEKGDKDEINNAMQATLNKHKPVETREGHVAFVGAGPGDPELLTLKARKALDAADVVIHDRLVTPEILELARREAILIDAGKEGFGPSMSQDDINALIVTHAKTGAQVVRLKGGDPTVFGRLDEEIDAVTEAGIGWHVVPGITAASASVAAIGQSLTKRGRNASARLLTGHDMKGFADHDWRALAQPGEVAAIYMGKKSARFIQGRLIMQGADRATPVTVIENASRPDQRILATTLDALPNALTEADITGPALMFYGLRPRETQASLAQLQHQELA